ncbi:MAG: hypothetical protein UR26_C0003G0111 [candidate division TM6 bacterium GW2011_GWF2_32_72]|nr:MAG: hypothetical protein UR26_C0003G0111 [candidate division TM6 bacterium GW2011_GWF2_32_72]
MNQIQEQNDQKLLQYIEISILLHILLLALFLLFSILNDEKRKERALEQEKLAAQKEYQIIQIKELPQYDLSSQHGTTENYQDIPEFKKEDGEKTQPELNISAEKPQKSTQKHTAEEIKETTRQIEQTNPKEKFDTKKDELKKSKDLKTNDVESKTEQNQEPEPVKATKNEPKTTIEQPTDQTEKTLPQKVISKPKPKPRPKESIAMRLPKIKQDGSGKKNASPITLPDIATGFLNYLDDRTKDRIKEAANPFADLAQIKMASYLQKINWYLQNSCKIYSEQILLEKEVDQIIVLHLVINKNGTISECSISPRISPYNLEILVHKILSKAGPFPPVPEHLNKEQFVLDMPIKINMPEGMGKPQFYVGSN